MAGGFPAHGGRRMPRYFRLVTKASSGGELPEGWRLDGDRLVHEAELHGWKLTVVSFLDAPWDGPTSLCIEPPDDPDVTVGTDGITAELMRSISLAEIRRTAKELRARLGHSAGETAVAAVLHRVETEREYALMAREYVHLVQQGYRSPITRLASAWGLSRNTISGRVRRARAMGFLDGPPGKPADRLTDKAWRHLEGDDARDSERGRIGGR
ncbi:hypothetical protein [Streptomyces yerevanensis]|uniref:hypothetical protein n=1 Tax=Streptomyces yerevanensis TaxID=66378 RepID=UPI0012FEAF85|nr:hypothetical protein [Streptomyces yerevanensis]